MFVLGYIDPGLGLLAWQAIVAAFLGFLFYVKKTRDMILALLRRPFRGVKPRGPASAGSPPGRTVT
jgi:hypothetical protein